MIIVRDSSPFPPRFHQSVMAIGNFDGLHLGHQAVIGKAVSFARRSGKPSAVLTFEPHPRRVFNPELPTPALLPFRQKAQILKDWGVDVLRVIRFTREFSQLGATRFVSEILHDELRVSHVVTGDDFIFGFNREGDTNYLSDHAGKLGINTTACVAVAIDGERCSSTRIRTALAGGNMPLAAVLLGRPYSITGRVQKGDGRGRKLGFPTANIFPGRMFMPMHGVYAVRVKLRGQMLEGVANVGTRPTFDSGLVLLEVHLFDWENPIYGEMLEVDFLKHLREERRFSSIDGLTTQIEEDCKAAKIFLKNRPKNADA